MLGAGVNVLDTAVLGRRPQGVGCMTRAPRTDLGPLQIGDGCVVGACVVLYRGTTIGRDTLLGDLCSVREECTVGDNSIIARGVTVNYNTRIGSRVKIQDNTHLTGNMVIEDGVFVSVLVSTTNDNSMDRGPHDSSKFGGPIIRRGASIGAAAVYCRDHDRRICRRWRRRRRTMCRPANSSPAIPRVVRRCRQTAPCDKLMSTPSVTIAEFIRDLRKSCSSRPAASPPERAWPR